MQVRALGRPLRSLGGDPWETRGGPVGDLWGTLEGRLGDPNREPLEDPRRTLGGPLPWGGPLGPTLVATLGDPWWTLDGPLGEPWRTLGVPSEDPRRILGGPLVDPWGAPWEELRTLHPQTSRLPRCVYTYLGLKCEVCVNAEIAKVCIHVPGPQNEICVQVQIA